MCSSRSFIRYLLALLLLTLPARGWALQARSGDAGWRATTVDGAHCVADRDGAGKVCWPAVPGSLLTDLAELADGWIAAGSEAGPRGQRLFLVRGNRDGSERLASPPAATKPRGRPQLVTDGATFRGLVWLEGDRQELLAVRAAEWLGAAWGPPMIVSPGGAGSQVAPSATQLDDGRWLVVWTAFDGVDDETRWSTWDGRRWSRPAPVHEDNAVPDITPSVLATPKGAAVAWAWFDGNDYRLRLAILEGGAWRDAPVPSGLGVASPRLTSSRGALLLDFSTVIPDSWMALELDSDGTVAGRAETSRVSSEPPSIDSVGYGVEFGWAEASEAVAWERQP